MLTYMMMIFKGWEVIFDEGSKCLNNIVVSRDSEIQ